MATERITVYFDGACPLCMREIAFYRKAKGAEKIVWADVSISEEAEITPTLSRCEALARFHLRTETGQLLSGAAAFAALWTNLDRFRLLGRLAQMPLINPALEVMYELFLRVRPILQQMARNGSKLSL